jgi:hypothetical protein
MAYNGLDLMTRGWLDAEKSAKLIARYDFDCNYNLHHFRQDGNGNMRHFRIRKVSWGSEASEWSYE